MNDTPISTALPAAAAQALVKAAQTANSVADPLRRQKAIEKATQNIKQQHPHLFKHQEI